MPELETRRCTECGTDFEGSEWGFAQVCDGCDRPKGFQIDRFTTEMIRNAQQQILNDYTRWQQATIQVPITTTNATIQGVDYRIPYRFTTTYNEG